jgi:replicative DNA helicase
MDKALKLITQKEAVRASYDRLVASRKKGFGLGGVSTGIDAVNLSIGGFLPEKVSIFAARSGIGKTGLINSFINGGHPVRSNKRGAYLILSWEMSPSLLVTREICRRKGMTQGMFINGASLIGDKTMKEITELYSEYAPYDVEYQTVTTNITTVKKLTKDFVTRCRDNEQKEGIEIQPIVVIDYVQMMKGEDGKLKTYQLLDFMIGLKEMANETGAHYAVLAQLQREVDAKSEPDRANLSDSKSIEDNTDNMVFLHRPEYNNNPLIRNPQTGEDEPSEDKMLIRTLKSRDYGTRDTLINCEIRYFRFWNLGDKWDTDFHHKYTQKKFWLEYFNLPQGDDNQLNLDQNK